MCEVKLFKIVDTRTGKFFGGEQYGSTFHRSRSYETHKAAEQERVRLQRHFQHRSISLVVTAYSCSEVKI